MKPLGWAVMPSGDCAVVHIWLYGNADITAYDETGEPCCVQYASEYYGESLSLGALTDWKFGAIVVLKAPETYLGGRCKKYLPYLYWRNAPRKEDSVSFDTLKKAKAYVEREYMEALFEGEL